MGGGRRLGLVVLIFLCLRGSRVFLRLCRLVRRDLGFFRGDFLRLVFLDGRIVCLIWFLFEVR